MRDQVECRENSIPTKAGSGAMGVGQPSRWRNWARRHPGVLLLGAVAVVVLALPEPARLHDVERDPGGEEVPLFI